MPTLAPRRSANVGARLTERAPRSRRGRQLEAYGTSCPLDHLPRKSARELVHALMYVLRELWKAFALDAGDVRVKAVKDGSQAEHLLLAK